MNDLVAAGFTAVEIRWDDPGGWVAGATGPRRLACRYATLARDLYNRVHVGAAASPFCATGTSAGASQIAYALSHYALGSIVDMVEMAGGPPHARLDYGCFCSSGVPLTGPCDDVPPFCYNSNSKLFDSSYGEPWCTNKDVTKASIFVSDSVLSGNLSYPTTYTRLLIGEHDGGSGASHGLLWFRAVNGRKDSACVPDAGHLLPDFFSGYTALKSDLLNHCSIQ